MDKGRMEAFSDGVIAIVITIMVLGITAPEGSGMDDLLGLVPGVVAYAVSFVGVGVYWNNHHHLLKLVGHVTGRLLWANLLFLFALSFFPLATDWLQKTGFAALPTTCYVLTNVFVSLTYMNLERVIRRNLACQLSHENVDASLGRSLRKERMTLALEAVALAVALLLPASHLAVLAMAVAFALWVVPDLRVVRLLDSLSTDDENGSGDAG